MVQHSITLVLSWKSLCVIVLEVLILTLVHLL